MKRLMIICCCSLSLIISAQQPVLKLPEEKKAMQPLKGVSTRRTDEPRLNVSPKRPGTYQMTPDNMPCVVPDMTKLENMPNAISPATPLPWMPNGFKPEKPVSPGDKNKKNTP